MKSAPPSRSAPRTVLGVFAHPDDEVVLGPLPARYAREGAAVRLAFATDGSEGVREHAGIPAGAALAAERRREAACACRALGADPPIFFGLDDGLGARESPEAAGLSARVRRLFEDLRPDVVITFGPDGVTGHPDHILVGAAVTRAYRSMAPADRPGALYYAGLEPEALAGLPPAAEPLVRAMTAGLRAAEGRGPAVRIPYRDEDLEKARRAFLCHRSQFTPAEAEEILDRIERLFADGVTLRRWTGETE